MEADRARTTTGENLRRLSIVIPAYNEATRLPATLEAIAAWAGGMQAVELIIVDDGSRDGTAAIAREFEQRAKPPLTVRVLASGVNRGKGASVRAGMLAATEPWVLMSDADLSTPIQEAEHLLAASGPFDLLCGSRAAAGARLEIRQPLYRELMGKTFNRMVRVLAVGGIGDTQCGFKLLRREAAQAIFRRAKVDRFAFDVELIYLARKLGFSVGEIPVIWRDSPEASKVNPVRDSARMFFDLLRIRRLHR